jgi:hypothetical protein
MGAPVITRETPEVKRRPVLCRNTRSAVPLLAITSAIICSVLAGSAVPYVKEFPNSDRWHMLNECASGDPDRLAAISENTLQIRSWVRLYKDSITASSELERVLDRGLFHWGVRKDPGDVTVPYLLLQNRLIWREGVRPGQRRAITRFGEFVRRALNTRPETIEFCNRPTNTEVPSDEYPFLMGTFASNVDWRIVVRYDGSRYRVSALDLGVR